MRRNQRDSPLSPGAPVEEGVPRPRQADATGAAPGNNAASDPATAGYAPEHPVTAMPRMTAVQVAAALVTVTGLWVAISSWFLTLQTPMAGNARADDLIIGLTAAATGMLAASWLRGLTSLPAVSVLAGIWLIVSPFILDAKFSITASMYWSNIWAGAVIIVASLALLGASQARTAH